MHAANQHIYLVALDEFVDVVSRLGRVGFVIDLEVLDLATGDLATEFGDMLAKTVFNRGAQGGKGAGVGQHQTDFEFARSLRCSHGCRQSREGQHVCGATGEQVQGMVHRKSPSLGFIKLQIAKISLSV